MKSGEISQQDWDKTPETIKALILQLRDLRGNNIPARKSLCRRIRPARWHIIKAQVP